MRNLVRALSLDRHRGTHAFSSYLHIRSHLDVTGVTDVYVKRPDHSGSVSVFPLPARYNVPGIRDIPHTIIVPNISPGL